MNRPESGTYICPNCRKPTKAVEWEWTYLGCEDCGGHPGAHCPNCGETVDFIFHEGQEVIEEAKGERYPL